MNRVDDVLCEFDSLVLIDVFVIPKERGRECRIPGPEGVLNGLVQITGSIGPQPLTAFISPMERIDIAMCLQPSSVRGGDIDTEDRLRVARLRTVHSLEQRVQPAAQLA